MTIGLISSFLRAGHSLTVASVIVPFLLGQPAVAAESGRLAELRAQALSLVNAARKQHGLNPLQSTEILNSAAQAHAEDMLRRNYYSHTSPEGETISDRYRDRGGSRWKKVAENIARCTGCPAVPSASRVAELQQGWMNSPGHRQNILANGLESFGFGIIGESGREFAVQTFAGPGVPVALQPDEEAAELSPPEQVDVAARMINRERRREGLAPVKASGALNAVAQRLVPKGESEERIMKQPDRLYDLLPEDSETQWKKIEVVAGGCGGCGAKPTAADIRYFVDQWLQDPQNGGTLLSSDATQIGFAMFANGEGRKIGIAVTGDTSE
ncbi:CAP domain-containing protein (plasmid) [Sinorhizobium meliloti]|uniref:CAP domain-containing protein n=1 Tax=Rhizobium meliloti TaxID=382 RepID=UPI002D79E212|nr:CAP domain-containing protein [Sinorhizobium meliloti]WRQ71894.1 CAP domain-containing protein [Sinorhizobium meliloti]